MPQVTVAGANNQIINLAYDSNTVASIAAQLASAITAGVKGGSIIASTDGASPLPTPGSGGGELVKTNNQLTAVPTGYKAIVNVSTSGLVFGSNDVGQSVLSGAGNLTFVANAGSGTVAGGSGNDQIVIGQKAGAWTVALDNGNDTVIDTSSAALTAILGTGKGVVNLSAGSGTANVTLGGTDTVLAGAGAATVDATAASSVYVKGGSGALTFIGSTGADTVVGGTGAVSIIGGSGNASFAGGANGGNLVQAGSGNDTIFGSSAGNDVLRFAKGSAGGTDLVQNFQGTDKVSLVGYGANEQANFIANQQVVSGSLTVTLSDNTKITFAGLTTKLTNSNFS